MKDQENSTRDIKGMHEEISNPFKLIVARSAKEKALVTAFLDGGPRIYKAYCRTHRRNLNDGWVEQIVMEQAMRNHKSESPSCIVSFKELVRDEA